MKFETLLLVNLIREDERKFHEAKIPYTGSTGIGAKPENYGGLAPYIATSVDQFNKSIEVMGWKDFSVIIKNDQWIVRNNQKMSRKERAYKELKKAIAYLHLELPEIVVKDIETKVDEYVEATENER